MDSEDYFKEIYEKGKPDIKELLAIKYCFGMTYVYTVLNELYHFTTEEDWNKLIFVKKINGQSVDWVTGMVLYMANSGAGDLPNPLKP